MIRSHSEFVEASAQCKWSHDQLAASREELRRKGLSSEEISIALGPNISAYEQQRAELASYERIKAGDLSDFRDLRSLGLLLIAARIASGRSKRDLAQEMEVHESQVSRDERNEYQGISVERAAQLLDALGVEFQIKARVLPPVAVDSFDIEPCMPVQDVEFEQESAGERSPSLRNAA